jgi:hypothetical protein
VHDSKVIPTAVAAVTLRTLRTVEPPGRYTRPTADYASVGYQKVTATNPVLGLPEPQRCMRKACRETAPSGLSRSASMALSYTVICFRGEFRHLFGDAWRGAR